MNSRGPLANPEAVRTALEAQRKVEHDFVDRARESEKAPQGWPAALVMFHVGMWRERMRTALLDVAEGRPQTLPPGPDETDSVNDAELARGIGTPLADASARCDHLLSEIIDLYLKLGERPFEWNVAKTTTAAVLRSSYIHPRLHIYQYLQQNGQQEAARKLFEDAVDDMRAAQAPAFLLGTVLYNLATVRAQQGRKDEALELIKEAIPLRPDAKELARTDEDLRDLRDDPRLSELLSS